MSTRAAKNLRRVPFTARVNFVDQAGRVLDRSRVFELEAHVGWGRGPQRVRAELWVNRQCVPFTFSLPTDDLRPSHITVSHCVETAKVVQRKVASIGGKTGATATIAYSQRIPKVSQVDIAVVGSAVASASTPSWRI